MGQGVHEICLGNLNNSGKNTLCGIGCCSLVDYVYAIYSTKPWSRNEHFRNRRLSRILQRLLAL